MNNTKTRKPNKRKTASWQLVLIVVLSVFIVATVFTGGYLLRSLLIKPQTGKTDSHTPVSYTHLDVYKRQRWGRR